MQEEVTSKTVAFYVKTGKMTASVLQKVLRAYLNAQHQKKTARKQAAKAEQKLTGRISVKELVKQNAGMTNIEITYKNIKSFEKSARKYQINYALKKDKTKDPPVYLVFFKGRDQDAITQAFRDYTAKEQKRANRPSIHQRMTKYRDMVNTMKKDKSRHRKQEIER